MSESTGKYTQQQTTFVDAFLEESFNGVDASIAAQIAKEKAGYSDAYSIDSILNTVQEEIVKRCGGRLAMQLPKAVKSVGSVMSDPTQEGARRILEALTIVMDRSGLVKKEQVEMDVKTDNGIVLIPAKNTKEL